MRIKAFEKMYFEFRGFKIHAAAVLGALALACLAAYASFRASFLGVAALAFLAAAVVVDLFLPAGETKSGKARKDRGQTAQARSDFKKLGIEIGLTIAIAIAAWLGLCFFLQTSSPLNVVTSCSMLPNLQRGDFIILQGGGVTTQEVVLPFSISKASAKYYISNCVWLPLGGSQNAENAETAGSGTQFKCVSGVEVNGVYFPARNENDVVVYEAQPAEYGLIIHRVLAKINASDGVFYLTKGDNNAAADQQSGISLVPESAVKGRVIGRIPFIGYFKLLLFLQFDFPPGCDRNLKYLD